MTNLTLITELAVAMRSQPSLTVLEVINEALDFTYATRKTETMWNLHSTNITEAWKPSNDDIVQALKKYNQARGN